MVNSRDHEAATALLLLDAPTIGPRRLLDYLGKQGSALAVLEHLRSSSSTTARLREWLEEATAEAYLKAVSETYALGGNYKLWSDEDYPSNLRRWEGRPPVLFYKGDMSRLGDRSLALVGRVDPTATGKDSAYRFARKCVENEITVISGLAKGIDGASHRASLEEPAGFTYGVVGHGLDFAYPRENRDLYGEVPRRGAIISQFRTGVGPQRWMFPARNEVMCTLALGTVIVEGKTGCGSIIQADFSFKHSRPVFILAKNLVSEDSAWAHDLVRRGAHVIERFDQVLRVMENTSTQVAWTAHGQSPLFDAPGTVASAGLTAAKKEPAMPLEQTEGRAALFDLDGVVVDSRAATAAAIAQIASDYLNRPIDPAEIQIAGAPHKALERLGVANAYNVYRNEYDNAFLRSAARVDVFQDVVERLRQLKDAGIRIAAITAQPRRRAAAMVPPDVQSLFEYFLCYNETGGKKERGIATCLQRFNVAANRAVYIGDTPSDLDAARKAGVRGIGVLWGFSEESELRKWTHDLLLASSADLTPETVRKVTASA